MNVADARIHPSQSVPDQMRYLEEVRRVAAATPGVTNKPVLCINQIRIMQAKSGGFPKHLYHATLPSILVGTEQEENALVPHGYGDRYIPQEYPRMLYRRNSTDKKFQKDDYVEMRHARDKEHEAQLREERIKHGITAWFGSVVELNKIHPAPDAPTVNPGEEIARLKGELAAMKHSPASAPSEELAAMRAEMAAMKAFVESLTANPQTEKRGPGRPPNKPAEE
jgi:hypothetical protein